MYYMFESLGSRLASLRGKVCQARSTRNASCKMYLILTFPISRARCTFFNAQGAKPVWYAKATRLVYETGEGPRFLSKRNFPCRHLSAHVIVSV